MVLGSLVPGSWVLGSQEWSLVPGPWVPGSWVLGSLVFGFLSLWIFESLALGLGPVEETEVKVSGECNTNFVA